MCEEKELSWRWLLHPCIPPRTQTCKADPRITDSEVRYVRDCLNPHKRAGPDGHLSEVLKPLSPRIAPVLALSFSTFIQTDYRNALVASVSKAGPIFITRGVCKMHEGILKESGRFACPIYLY